MIRWCFVCASPFFSVKRVCFRFNLYSCSFQLLPSVKAVFIVFVNELCFEPPFAILVAYWFCYTVIIGLDDIVSDVRPFLLEVDTAFTLNNAHFYSLFICCRFSTTYYQCLRRFMCRVLTMGCAEFISVISFWWLIILWLASSQTFACILRLVLNL